MAVKIRLARRGRKKLAIYDVVVADVRAPRDGRFIDILGLYNPNTNPSTVEINDDKAFKWLMNGAQPTDTVRNLLSDRGVLLKKHLQIGVNKGAISQEEADKKFAAWFAEKEEKLSKQLESLAKTKSSKEKARLEAEALEAEASTQEETATTTVSEEVAPESGEKLEAEEPTQEETITTPVAEEAPESGEKLEAVEPAQEETTKKPPVSEEVAPESDDEPEATEDTEEKDSEEK